MPKSYEPPSRPDDRRTRHLRRVAWERSHPTGVFTGVPTFLRAALRAASAGRAGYYEPGYEHGRHVRDLDPLRVEVDDWLREVDDGLIPLADASDEAGALKWLVDHYPYVMRLVPARRRGRYVAGFIDGVLED